MAAPDWQSELADIILQLWMEDVTAWVTVDQVRSELAQYLERTTCRFNGNRRR